MTRVAQMLQHLAQMLCLAEGVLVVLERRQDRPGLAEEQLHSRELLDLVQESVLGLGRQEGHVQWLVAAHCCVLQVVSQVVQGLQLFGREGLRHGSH